MALEEKVTVRAEVIVDDKTKTGLASIKNNAGALSNSFKQTSAQASALTASTGALTKSFIASGIALFGLHSAVQAITSAFKASISEATRYQAAMIGLSSVAAAFSQSQGDARKAALELSQDGLLSVTEAAEGLKNLLGTGFGLDQAITLMKGFKDAAAFNRQGTLEFGQAIVGATQGIKNQNSIMVDNVGITKNLSIIMKEAGLSVEDLGSITTDASVRQKLYNGLLRETAVFEGDAARASETLQGSTSQLRTQIKLLEASVGAALAPALQFLAEATVNAIKAMMPAPETMVAVARAALQLAAAVKIAAQSLLGFVKSGVQFITGQYQKSFETLKGTIGKVADTAGTAQEKVRSITVEGIQNMTNIARNAVGSMDSVATNAAKKAADLAKKVSDEIRGYTEDLQKMTRNFEESLTDLLFAHKDKTERLQTDIAKENKAFKEATETREKRFAKEMKGIEKSHADKTKQINDDIKEETARMEEALQKQQAFQDDKYLTQAEKSRERIEELKANLRTEEEEYREKTNEVKLTFEEETDKAKEEHNERLQSLQKELDAELALQKKYADEFAKVKDQEAEDDITRLKRKFAQEASERQRDHERRLQDLYQQGRSEQESYNQGRAQASAESAQRQIEKTSEEAGKAAQQQISGDRAAAERLYQRVFEPLAPKTQQSGAERLFNRLFPLSFQRAGEVPGAVGQPQLAVVHGGEQIERKTAAAGDGGGGVQIVINNGTFLGTKSEARRFAMMIWEHVGQLAKSRNMNPDELLRLRIGATIT